MCGLFLGYFMFYSTGKCWWRILGERGTRCANLSKCMNRLVNFNYLLSHFEMYVNYTIIVTLYSVVHIN